MQGPHPGLAHHVIPTPQQSNIDGPGTTISHRHPTARQQTIDIAHVTALPYVNGFFDQTLIHMQHPTPRSPHTAPLQSFETSGSSPNLPSLAGRPLIGVLYICLGLLILTQNSYAQMVQMDECGSGNVMVNNERGPIACPGLTSGVTISFGNQGSITSTDESGIILRGKIGTGGNRGDITIEGAKISTTRIMGEEIYGINVSGKFDNFSAKIAEIVAEGDSVTGIRIDRDGDPVDNTENTMLTIGRIRTNGQNAHGIWYSGHQNPSDMNPAFSIDVEGRIETVGAGSSGIIIEAPNAAIDVTIDSGGEVRVNKIHTYSVNEMDSMPIYALFLSGYNNGPPNKSAKIDNRGLVSGSVYADGCAQFNNHGVLEQAASIRLGVKGANSCESDDSPSFTNSGTVRVGGAGEIRGMALTGDFIQEADGVLEIDVKGVNGEIDHLHIDGDAMIAGQIDFNVLSYPQLTREAYEAETQYSLGEFLSVECPADSKDCLTTPDLDSLAFDTILLDFAVEREQIGMKETLEAAMQLTGLDLLNRNERSVFWGLNVARNQGSEGADGVVVEALEQTDLPMLRLDLDRAGNEIAANAMHATLAMAGTGEGVGCRESGGESHPVPGCVFVAPVLQDLEIGGTFEQRPFAIERRGVIAGLALYPEGVVDEYRLSLASQKVTIDMPHVARATGDGTGLAVRAAGTIGPVGIHASAHRGSVDYAVTRTLPSASATRTIKGASGHRSTGVAAGLTVPFEVLGAAVRPRVGLMRTRITSRGYSEAGEDDLALTVAGSAMTVTRLSGGGDVTFPPFALGGLASAVVLGVQVNRYRGGEARVMSSLAEPDTAFVSTTRWPGRETGMELGLALSGAGGQFAGHVGVGVGSSEGGGSTRSLHLAAEYNF